jgi:hypothetical protein
MTTTPVRRHPRKTLPLVLGALAVGCGIVAWTLSARRRAEDQRIVEAASRTRSDLEQGLQRVLQELTADVRRATALPPLRAALEHDVDTATLRDLLATEEWWAPFRDRLLVVVGPDGRLMDSGPRAQGLLDPALVAQARAQPPAAAWVGTDEIAAAAALPVRTGGRRKTAVHLVVLGRPLDRALVQPLADRLSMDLLLSDGGRGLLFVGKETHRQTLAGLTGAEGQGVRVDRLRRWVAAAVELRPGRWLWGSRELTGPPILAIWLMPALLVVAALAGALGLGLALRRRSEPAPPASAPGGSGLSLPSGHAGADQPTAILNGLGQAFGRYALIERIGEGGMSELFTAALSGAEGFRRLYVIKRLKPQIAQNKAAVDQFIDEAKLGSLLVHSNIVPVFDFGKVGSGYFLAQEYITGRNVAQIVGRHIERVGQPLDVRTVLYIAREVLDALAYAHERANEDGQWLSIVHRDVSSTNIMVTSQGEVKLFDFGIVSAVDRISSTEIGRIKGNAAFMSPEQARGQPVDARSDLFSLGMVMYAALTGETLYGAGNPAAAFYEATAGVTADHLARIRALPEPMPAILEKALAMDPGGRYASARDFGDAIAPHTANLKTELATLMNALFGEDLRRQAAGFRAKLGALASQRGS